MFALTRRVLNKSAAALLVSPSFARAEVGIYPRVIEHSFGRTEVRWTPRRLVTIGYGDEAPFLALGHKPVGIVYSGMFPSGMTPWCEQKFGAQKPELLDGGMIDFEDIARLKPDLIVGVFSQLDAVSYGRLSQIAPTIAYRSGPWRAEWREQTEIAGAILGLDDRARQLIDETERLLRSYGDAYPALKGKSFTFGSYFAGSSRIVVYLPGETRVDWMIEIGMRPSRGVRRLAEAGGGHVSSDASLEDLESVAADLLVMWYEPGARSALESQSLFQMFSPVRQGRYVALDDPTEIWAASWPSVLAIPYAFPGFLPRLADAAKNSERQ
ncbi:iron complex transport system substrate-binding protein [Rhizobium sp. SG_E_25_P2]|uniref:ABC transporter substrate-binding protein n=1 Tax=Rhizobium sp. SG_E_25_P2 TaxID=2879942 RepID=UPI0024735EE0|nr:ABC transporter substrate-binding protein [Rhizobium sp. SG_E_25_P2]MDH6269597.1 iron complex transport system substrate-binding protein [Rhizobium sp. SG_E_25_P2]